MTLRQALTLATEQLASNSSLGDHAHRDAELLLLHVLKLDRATLLAYPTRPLTEQQLASYEDAIARRLRHEPIQYITGQQEFFGLPLKVTSATLIPRPETEHLVEAVLARLPVDQPVRILDIGTGTGAIALALADQLPQAQVTAVDLSAEALKVAQENAVTHHLTGRVRFLLSDLLTALPQNEQTAAFDVIVSNPPYIPEGDRAELHPQVRDYEPQQALFAGVLGLDIYRRLIPQAHAALKPGGLLALEIGYGQSEALASLLDDWKDISFVADLQQIPRVVLARR
ncbi:MULTISPECIES: peptide chain release factor N(5)-glutamine methyltransferase [Acidobacteriaceae]|uniref:peptide chain release factor N(5)-glutamine methyltransferase n=1 Tax=Acidobacteriaceae TaxID=204434 RepID=UPI00131DF5D4|nr:MULTISPECIES: peptide chain release factor N(5)-glutamine methyltransferase [Acidobacteriaceae]MDW5265791.1 peptide chain release factor N(5)-glutamine methyltransferase [Edaphobacter sp.]